MKKLGFTLAEVLITLVIIGVIASMTIPTLMSNTNSQEFRSALKKAISMLNQALTLHYALNGMTAADYKGDAELVSGVFKKRLSVIDGNSTFTNKDICSGDAVFTTADGMIFCVNGFKGEDSEGKTCDSYNTQPCGSSPNIWIDVNGLKAPNTLTTSSSRPKDIYQATIYSQKVLPEGNPTQEVMYEAGTEGGVEVNREKDK